ncbi:GM15404 [Drosophila sechellia]|uniref:GM15404 n=1 Tax=Drosophila sechellia TaxID=7238 RepID=B4IBQ5_DROSE|nr:GM15404 [Drosophila sechellia]
MDVKESVLFASLVLARAYGSAVFHSGHARSMLLCCHSPATSSVVKFLRQRSTLRSQEVPLSPVVVKPLPIPFRDFDHWAQPEIASDVPFPQQAAGY